MLLLGYCDLPVIAGVSLFYEVYFKRLSRAFKVRDRGLFALVCRLNEEQDSAELGKEAPSDMLSFGEVNSRLHRAL